MGKWGKNNLLLRFLCLGFFCERIAEIIVKKVPQENDALTFGPTGVNAYFTLLQLSLIRIAWAFACTLHWGAPVTHASLYFAGFSLFAVQATCWSPIWNWDFLSSWKSRKTLTLAKKIPISYFPWYVERWIWVDKEWHRFYDTNSLNISFSNS